MVCSLINLFLLYLKYLFKFINFILIYFCLLKKLLRINTYFEGKCGKLIDFEGRL